MYCMVIYGNYNISFIKSNCYANFGEIFDIN